MGLTRGFFAAGARRVVASLWRVQDRSTAELMDRFYICCATGCGRRRRCAPRSWGCSPIRSPPTPYHWAAFAVYGDWR